MRWRSARVSRSLPAGVSPSPTADVSSSLPKGGFRALYRGGAKKWFQFSPSQRKNYHKIHLSKTLNTPQHCGEIQMIRLLGNHQMLYCLLAMLLNSSCRHWQKVKLSPLKRKNYHYTPSIELRKRVITLEMTAISTFSGGAEKYKRYQKHLKTVKVQIREGIFPASGKNHSRSTRAALSHCLLLVKASFQLIKMHKLKSPECRHVCKAVLCRNRLYVEIVFMSKSSETLVLANT